MKILISQTASLGDLILSTPLIEGALRKHPDSKIWFMASTAGANLLKSDERLSGVISYDKKDGLVGLFKKAFEIRSHKFDLVYAVQRSARASIVFRLAGIPRRRGFRSSALAFLFSELIDRPKTLHDVERNYSLLELYETKKPELYLSIPKSETLSTGIKSIADSPFIAIFPGSLWETKKWQANNFAELGKVLTDSGQRCIFFGTQSEKELVDSCAQASRSLSLAGQTSLQDLIYLISKSQVLVCNDSSSLHIASAFKIPTVCIFCATSPSFGFGPWQNSRSIIIESKQLWCRPCARHGGDFCPTGTKACMSSTGETSVTEVAKAVLRLL